MAQRILNFNQHYNSKKLILSLDISTYCNAGCPQCHRTDTNGLAKASWLPLIQWTIQDFKDTYSIDSLKNINQVEFCGTWGDPIMVKDIFKITEYILNSSDANILFNTNGSIRNHDWWWNFGLLGGKRITIVWAVDGSTQEIHSKYRQNTDLELIMENMQSFTSAGGHSQVFTVVFKHNQFNLYDIANLAKKNGASGISFVQSNRFRSDEPIFNFIDTKGQKDYLEKTTLNDDMGFWKNLDYLDLNNEEDMIKIKMI